ncbi:PilZ domain protein [Poriferisphaera corsica]|uniref:PilZ domain protein n=1 Tax=Poriferisphaera corsica TaxID=2528020 RepID=A0A517YV06_9BACT|nr:PilZ domain-containing protein [Poriferisphaera corsica]QDU34030.1 PilZ domain protein [Poriferisphaera corsica]
MYHVPERRKDLRIRIARSVKIYNHLTGKYLAGKTLDVSAGGAMIVFGQHAKLHPGQRIQVGIARDARQALLAAEDMLDATVIRSLSQSLGVRVAIEFDERRSMSKAA